jgi:CHAT domain-containing protein
MADSDEFVVCISPGSAQAQYSVRATAGQGGEGGEAYSSFGAELPRLSDLAAQLAGRPLQMPQRSLDLAQKIGAGLFNQLFSGDTRSLYYQALGAAGLDHGLRIDLNLTAVPELMDLPWEFLNDGTDYIALRAAIVRQLGVPRPVRPTKVEDKIRMLVVAGPAPRPYQSLDITSETTRIIDSVQELKNSGQVEIVVSRPVLSEVERLLSNGQFHILHFIGHGDRDEASDESTLVFVDDGQPDLVSGSVLGTILGGHASLQLVLLNACEGARTDYRDPFKGVASALVKAGISVVVAMQGAITDGAASNFAGAFYEKLIAMAMPYDDALLSARRNLYAAGRKYLEWATPVLFSRTKNGQIFKLPQEHFPSLEPTPAAQLAPVAASPPGQPAPASGEADVIRRLVQSSTPPEPTPPEPGPRKLKIPENLKAAPGTPLSDLVLKFSESLTDGQPKAEEPKKVAPDFDGWDQVITGDSPPAPPQDRPHPPTQFHYEDLGPPKLSPNSDAARKQAQPAPAQPVFSQPVFPQPALPQPVVAPLQQILCGNWAVELRAPQYGVMTMTLTLIALPSGQWQFEGHVWGAPVMVRGNWQVYGNQLSLDGVRMVGGPFPQQYPYGVLIRFGSWNNQQLAGVTAVGENVFWNRQG